MKGKKLPVYRANLPRTLTAVVALLLTLAATRAFAREFRAADTQSEDYPTVQALRYIGHLIEERSGRRLQIRVFHSRQLGEEKETGEQARVGAIDLNRTNVELPYGQVLTGLSTRLVGGAEDNWPSFITTDRFSHFYTFTGHTMSPEVLVMAPLYEKAMRDPATAARIERIRKLE